jgi:alkylation response protein AidB-like acyl-CoA dehydrogenase
MDFRLTDDQRMLAETLGRFLTDKYPLAKRHEIVRSEARFSRELWKRLAELGAVGALFGEDVGGYGGSGADLGVVFEALGRHLVVEPFLPTLLAGSLIAALGNKAQKARLGEIVAGQTLVAFAHGEPQARYELGHVGLKATKTAKGWSLRGDKSGVLGGEAADLLIVSARTAGKAHDPAGISLFLVDAGAPGMSRRGYATVDGYPAAEIAFTGVAAEPLGKTGSALKAIEAAIARALVALCAESLGAMERAKDLTIEYMHTRKQFGVPIGAFQALQHRMADVLIELEQMRSAVINAAGHLHDKRRDWHVSAAKHLAGRIGRQVAEEAIQIHGGMGMTWEYPVGHFAKRITMIDHLFGDADHHLERVMGMGR